MFERQNSPSSHSEFLLRGGPCRSDEGGSGFSNTVLASLANLEAESRLQRQILLEISASLRVEVDAKTPRADGQTSQNSQAVLGAGRHRMSDPTSNFAVPRLPHPLHSSNAMVPQKSNDSCTTGGSWLDPPARLRNSDTGQPAKGVDNAQNLVDGRHRGESRSSSPVAASLRERLSQDGSVKSFAFRRGSLRQSHEGMFVMLTTAESPRGVTLASPRTIHSDDEVASDGVAPLGGFDVLKEEQADMDGIRSNETSVCLSDRLKAMKLKLNGVSKSAILSNTEDGSMTPGPRHGRFRLEQRPMVRAEKSVLASNLELEYMVRKQAIFVCFPDVWYRALWDAFVILAIAVSLAIIPCALVYLDGDVEQSSPAATLVFIADLVFMLDIPINFRTAVPAKTGVGEDVVHSQEIALHYLRTWFMIDLLSAWPFLLLPKNLTVRTVALGVKCLRAVRFSTLFPRIQVMNLYLAMLLKISTVVTLPANMLACGWRVAQRWDGAPDLPGTVWHTYVADLYWVQMTMTTIGYGDIATVGTWSRLYAIVSMLFASVVFGAILSVITLLSRGMLDDTSEKRVSQAVRFMKRRRVPAMLRHHVERSLRHALIWENHLSMDQELFQRLAPAVQRELSLALLSGTFTSFPLFHGASRAFIAELAHTTTWVSCLYGDPIVEEGHLSQEVVFVVHGSLTVLFSQHSEGKHIFVPMARVAEEKNDEFQFAQINFAPGHLHAGAWFGEESLFSRMHISCATVAAAAECELAILEAESYKQVVSRYPRLLSRHQVLEDRINSGLIDISDLRHTQPKRNSEGAPQAEFSHIWRLMGCSSTGIRSQLGMSRFRSVEARVAPCRPDELHSVVATSQPEED